MLHIFLAPAPQAVEDVLLTKLHGNHHAVRHTLCTGIVVLDVGNVTHSIANFEIHFVGTSEDVVEYFLQLGVDIGLRVAHVNKKVTILSGFERTFFQRREGHCIDGQ